MSVIWCACPPAGREPCSRTSWTPPSPWRRKRTPSPTSPTTLSGRKSSCMYLIWSSFSSNVNSVGGGEAFQKQPTVALHQHHWQGVIISSLTPCLCVLHLQGHDDDRLRLVSYHQTLGGSEQGGWTGRFLNIKRNLRGAKKRSRETKEEMYYWFLL